MEKLKYYIVQNFEQVFVLIILLTIVLLNYYIPHKIAFLNFYFFPIIMAGYFLDLYRSVIGALLCILIVTAYIIIYPQGFFIQSTGLNLLFYIILWGSILILSGNVVGKQHEKLNQKITQINDLNIKLKQNQENLKNVNLALSDYSETLESKIKQRTEDIEKSKKDIELLKAKVENTLYSAMDSTVAKLIIEGKLKSEKRKISVLFSDLAGFTSYSEKQLPELVVRDLNSYLNNMEPILLSYYAHIDKYMGDGIMCEFGAPINYDNHQLLAVLAGLKMQKKMKELKFPWQMRIGISSGESIIGLIGSRRQSYTTIGGVVNIASHLEKVCPPGSVLIDAPTMEKVQHFLDIKFKKKLLNSVKINSKAEIDLEELHQKLINTNDNLQRGSLCYKLGILYKSLNEIFEAYDYLKMALEIFPNNNEIKLAFAEIAILTSKNNKINARIKRQRISAYEATQIKDPLIDRKKIPSTFYEKYHYVEDLINIEEDIILPIEALDGSIGHSKIVAILSYAIASELNVSELEKIEILKAGFLEDIGKIVIPHHLYNASGILKANELKEIQKHPVEGISILKNMGYNSELMLQIIRHSHEKFNGSGYPDGLKGEEIPIGSRIIAVADAYDVMTSWRPYREKWDRNAAFDELNKCVNLKEFDPKIVKCLINLLSTTT